MAAKPLLPHPADPFADPAHDPYNALKYIPNNTLTLVGLNLYLVVGVLQTICMFKWRALYMLPMTLGIYAYGIGLGLRNPLAKDPESRGLFIGMYLFVLLSPCLFIATNYSLLGRLAVYVKGEKYLIIRASRVTKVFVLSDVFTFLMQALGGAIVVTSSQNFNLKQMDIGNKITLAGLGIQLISFALFATIYIVFLIRMRLNGSWPKPEHSGTRFWNRWECIGVALIVNCVVILIRSVFRMLEFKEGFNGHLATTESLFYGFDTLPMWIAIAIYVPFWPGRVLGNVHFESKPPETENYDMLPVGNGQGQ